MDKCADLATRHCGNTAIAAMLAGGKESIGLGRPISTGFSKGVPHDFLSIWKTGEVSGKMDETLQALSDKSFEQARSYFMAFTFWLRWLVGALLVVSVTYQIYTQAGRLIAPVLYDSSS